MKNETFEGLIENFWGRAIVPAVPYKATVDQFDGIDELKAANEFPKESEIVTFVNARKKAAARQAAMIAHLEAAGFKKPTLENDDQLKLREMAKIFVAAGKSEADAKVAASNALGIEWA